MVWGPKDMKERREKEREEEYRNGNNLTLACGDVAVSPVDPVFIICDVAPRLHIPIRVPAEARVSLHQPTSTWDVWTLLSDSLRGEHIRSGASRPQWKPG